MKIINFKNIFQAEAVLKKIGVDPYGIDAMLPKSMNINIFLDNLPCKTANIIKQEMLSVGGDAAVNRGSIACSIAATDALIMGTIKQVAAFSRKIEKQPFGLNFIARNIREFIDNICQQSYVLKTSRREITLGRKTQIMGILNVTPDSFSDGGLFSDPQKAIDHGLQMIDQGADIIDIGGESTRPGAASVSEADELKRVIPVISELARQSNIPISIDTSKAKIAAEAIAAGAEIVNDISAGKDIKMMQIVKESQAAFILMHMRGEPQNMQKGDLTYRDLTGEITSFLKNKIEKAIEAGIEKECLIVDPGIGFGKTTEDNLRIINNLRELKILGLPIMIGASRKAFLGKITGGEPQERIEGTAAANVAAIMNGCHIIRIHDIAFMKKIAAVTDEILHAGEEI
ncbi:MAG: dihydropteroate synthase [Smithella sp.]